MRCTTTSTTRATIRSLTTRCASTLGGGASTRLTASIGYTCFPFFPKEPHRLSWDQVLSIADRAMYLVKQSGRNGWVGILSNGNTTSQDLDGLTDSLSFANRLREELDVQVMPGAFFGVEGTVRVSFGLPPGPLQKALEMLALGIGALAR